MASPNDPSASHAASGTSTEASSASASPSVASPAASTPDTRSTSTSPITTSTSQEETPHVCTDGPVYLSCPKAGCKIRRRFQCFPDNCFDEQFWKNRECRYCADTTYEEEFVAKHTIAFKENAKYMREFKVAVDATRSLNGLKLVGSAVCETCGVVQPVKRQCYRCTISVKYDCRLIKDGCNNVPDSYEKLDRFYICENCEPKQEPGPIKFDPLNSENFCYVCMKSQPTTKYCQQECGKEYLAVCNFPPVCWNVDADRTPTIDTCTSCMVRQEKKEESENATEQERIKRDREEGPGASGVESPFASSTKKKRPQPPPIL